MPSFSGSRDSSGRIEAMIRSTLNTDQGRRKIAAAQNALLAKAVSGALTVDSAVELFKRELDKAVANYLSHDCNDRVGYHAYAASGLALREARRLADQFLSSAGRTGRE